jgi:hypothetical protein
MNQKTHILLTSANEESKNIYVVYVTSSNEEKNHHIIVQWHGHEIQWHGQEIIRSDGSNNSWNMMSMTVRVGTMNKLQQHITKTTIKQVMLPGYSVSGHHG